MSLYENTSTRMRQQKTGIDDVLAGYSGVVDVVNCGSEDGRK